MKSGHILLLAAILIATVLNLLVSLGVIGTEETSSSPSSSTWEYRMMSGAEMDEVGFQAVAADEGIEPDEKGNMQLPQKKLILQALMPRTLEELQKDDWELIATEVTQGINFFIFRRPKQ